MNKKELIKYYAVSLINTQFKTKSSIKRTINNMWYARQRIANVNDEFDAYFFVSQSDLSYLQYQFKENWNIDDEREISKAAFEILKEKNSPVTRLFEN